MRDHRWTRIFIRLRRNTLQLSAGLRGKVNRTTCLDGVLTKPEAHQSEGGLLLLYHFNVEMATAQFRFDTPTVCVGKLHSDPVLPEQIAEKIIQICGKSYGKSPANSFLLPQLSCLKIKNGAF